MESFVLLLVLSVFLLPSSSQILSSQPWFRGVLSSIPILNGDLEQTAENYLSDRHVVSIEDGTLSGVTLKTANNREIKAFQSIPYGQPPTGQLRFRDPLKNLPWNGTRDAGVESPQCIQLDFSRPPLIIRGQEDCLYLNVYAPREAVSKNVPLPVMVFIHGGAFSEGAGTAYGPRYLLDHDIVLVTFNYRLGPFGFFSTGDDVSPGNQGLKDQVMVLQWIQQNIGAFGGDPGSVTLFGQSAGASAVGFHLVSPLSRGLFHRAISQSGSAFCHIANLRNASSIAQRVGETFKCPSDNSSEMVNCLRKIPEKLLAPVQLAFAEWLVFPRFWFTPIVEHDHASAFMTKDPLEYYKSREVANVNYIAGLTMNELSLIVAGIKRSPIHVNDINTNWNSVGRPSLNFNRHTIEPSEEKMHRIWRFYMGDEKLKWETRLKFSQIPSDGILTKCTIDAIRYHSMYTNGIVYGYRLSYQGRYSIVQQFGAKPENWGVVHDDDLIYLLDNPDYWPNLNPGDPEMEMSTMMTSLWTNFASNGNPQFSKNGTDNNARYVWDPVHAVGDQFSPLRFLDLNLNASMIDDPYLERYNFWRNEIFEDDEG